MASHPMNIQVCGLRLVIPRFPPPLFDVSLFRQAAMAEDVCMGAC